MKPTSVKDLTVWTCGGLDCCSEMLERPCSYLTRLSNFWEDSWQMLLGVANVLIASVLESSPALPAVSAETQ